MSGTFTYMKFISCHLILGIIIPTLIKKINLEVGEIQDHTTGKQ